MLAMDPNLLVVAVTMLGIVSPLQAAPEPPAGDVVVDRSPSDSLTITIAPSTLDAVRKTLGRPGNRAGVVRPRVLVLFGEMDGPLGEVDPLDAPFYRRPQPIRSIPIDRESLFTATEPLRLELGDDVDGVASVPDRLADLDGGFRMRAVLDLGLGRGHAEPGHAISAITTHEFDESAADAVELVIERTIDAEPRVELDNLEWVEIPSPLLTSSLGRPVRHRAGVAFPPEYHDLDADRRFWPVVYVVPGFGGDERGAETWARLLSDPTMDASMPPAVFVVLDPEDPLGHHGFIDGDNVGPRGTALVEEFIPWLERRFRLVPDPSARFLLGHSSGGWSTIWLQLEHPGTFGACFSTAPDPVDFTAFGTVDLLRDRTIHEDEEGRPRPSHRRPLSPDLDHVLMTVAEETAMEHALAPDGTSGEQWSTWNAMFSGRDPRTGRPLMAYDLRSGEIDPGIVRRDWLRFDITDRLRRDPEGVAPILLERVRLLCGDRDCYYLEEAVARLAAELARSQERLGLEATGGSIEIVPGATHDTIVGHAMRRWLPELGELAGRAPLR